MPRLADPRKGLNPELFTEKAGSDLWVDHTAGYLVPKALYAKDHPEYYAMGKDGKRVTGFTDHGTPLCLSNPDVTRISIERALGWIEQEKDKKFFMITYGDTTSWCQCSNCLALDPAPGEYSTRLLSWVNPIARAIAARFPDKIIMTLAYAGSDAAPPQIRPETNVWVVGSTGLGNVRFWDHAMGAQEKLAESGNMKKVSGWLAVAPHQYLVCEYLGQYEPCLVDNTASRLRYYSQRGLRGIFATYGRPANFSQLWAYLWGRLLWNPDQDAHALACDYIRDHYKKAADPLIRYFDLTHRQYRATLDQAGQMTNAWAFPPAYYQERFIQQALACFAEAEQKSDGDSGLKRELEQEEKQLLGDAASHQPVLDPVPQSNQPLLSLLKRSRGLARTPEDRQEFVRSLSALGRKLEETKPGYQNLLAGWFAQSGNCGPKVTAHQLRFPPESFLWADSGPGIFTDGPKEVTKSSTPPKPCVGVLAHLYSSYHKVWTSSTMEARFQLLSATASRPVTLEIEGQDSLTKWAGKRELEWKVEIAIALNGTNIFAGESGFARGAWSKRNFAVEPGLLRSGENRLEIRNVSRHAGFAGPEFLLASATLTY
jgi:hypothetical protein